MPPSKRLEWTGRAEREYLQALAFIAEDSGARNAALVLQRIAPTRIQILRFLHQRMNYR